MSSAQGLVLICLFICLSSGTNANRIRRGGDDNSIVHFEAERDIDTVDEGNSEVGDTIPYIPLRVVCPDGNVCAFHDTCCVVSEKHYGCCPFIMGVCCADHKTCCPQGYHCDPVTKECGLGFHSIPAPVIAF